MKKILLIPILAILSTTPAYAAYGGGHGGGGGGGGDGGGGGWWLDWSSADRWCYRLRPGLSLPVLCTLLLAFDTHTMLHPFMRNHSRSMHLRLQPMHHPLPRHRHSSSGISVLPPKDITPTWLRARVVGRPCRLLPQMLYRMHQTELLGHDKGATFIARNFSVWLLPPCADPFPTCL